MLKVIVEDTEPTEGLAQVTISYYAPVGKLTVQYAEAERMIPHLIAAGEDVDDRRVGEPVII